MMNKLIASIIVVGVSGVILWSSVFVINKREQAIVLRFGEIQRVATEPGLYFKIPTNLIEDVQIIEKRLLRYDLEDQTFQVSGGKFYKVDAFLTYQITDPKLFRQQLQGRLSQAESRLSTRLNSALRSVYGRRDFDAALSEQRTEMMREARETMRVAVAGLGLEIKDVRIKRTDLTDQVSQDTFNRMIAEREAEAALLRASGNEKKTIIQANANRQAVEIVSEARRKAEVIRGEGDAERNRIFAEAFNRDPEFFEFYRSMQSYRTALRDSGTTLVLSPDSEFFQFFKSDGLAPGSQTNRVVQPAVAAQ